MSCSLNVELKTQQLSKCGGITSNSLCGTSFNNEKWNEVRNISVHHNNEFNYKISSVHRVKLSTLPLNSHPIWSYIELPVVQVQYTVTYYFNIAASCAITFGLWMVLNPNVCFVASKLTTHLPIFISLSR